MSTNEISNDEPLREVGEDLPEGTVLDDELLAGRAMRTRWAARFPRRACWGEDLNPKGADTLAFLQRLLSKARAGMTGP